MSFHYYHYAATVFFIITLIQAPNALGAVLTTSFYFPGDLANGPASQNGEMIFAGDSNGVTTWFFVEPQAPTLTATLIEGANVAVVLLSVNPTFVASLSCNIRGTQAVCLNIDVNPQNGVVTTSTHTEDVQFDDFLVIGPPSSTPTPPPAPPPQSQSQPPHATPTSKSPTPVPTASSGGNGGGGQAPPATSSSTGATTPSQTIADGNTTPPPSSPSSAPSSSSSSSSASSPPTNSSSSEGSQSDSRPSTGGSAGDQGFIPAQGSTPSKASLARSAPISFVIYVLLIGIYACVS